MRVLSGEVVGVFAHVERADEDRACCLQPLDERLVAGRGRPLTIDLRAGERRNAGDVEQVLHRKWNAREWPQLSAILARTINGARLREGALPGHGGKRIQYQV